MRFLIFTLLVALCSYAQQIATIEHEGATYRTFTASPGEVHLHWKNAQGGKLKTFTALSTYLTSQSISPIMFTNAGLYEDTETPCGLHIEAGSEFTPLNLRDAPGNFYLKPNGVFFISEQKAQILESSAYSKAQLSPRLAVQSGPLLLDKGKIHPKFNKGSSSKLLRSGIGINQEGHVVFAITDTGEAVNFHQFASLFLHLGCQDALFLDGNISQMTTNAAKAHNKNYAAMFAIYKK